MGVLKHGNGQHHGVGITTPVPVTPAVAGIAARRDYVLERPADLLEQKAR
jgi:hypothetical protein